MKRNVFYSRRLIGYPPPRKIWLFLLHSESAHGAQIQVLKKNIIEFGYYTRKKIHLLRLLKRYIIQLHNYII